MKLKRPHIPLRVRCEVVAEQLLRAGRLQVVLEAVVYFGNNHRGALGHMLRGMFGAERVHLDHCPALCLREIIDAEKGIYDPPANDPDFLVYRLADAHDVKTRVRGDGAQFSDLALLRREKRRCAKEALAMPSEAQPGLAQLSRAKHRVAKRGMPSGGAGRSSDRPASSRWPPRGSRRLPSRPSPWTWKPR